MADLPVQDSRYIHFTDAYPLTASGKVQKYLLREQAARLCPTPDVLINRKNAGHPPRFYFTIHFPDDSERHLLVLPVDPVDELHEAVAPDGLGQLEQLAAFLHAAGQAPKGTSTQTLTG